MWWETRIYKKNFERLSGRGETVEIVKILIKSDQKNDLRGRHRFFGKSQHFWAARFVRKTTTGSGLINFFHPE